MYEISIQIEIFKYLAPRYRGQTINSPLAENNMIPFIPCEWYHETLLYDFPIWFFGRNHIWRNVEEKRQFSFRFTFIDWLLPEKDK